jgi:photosystem II stability/assembly factor-like uncharacterized protein
LPLRAGLLILLVLASARAEASVDGWRPAHVPFHGATALVADPTTARTVYAAGGGGIAMSVDAGSTWRTLGGLRGDSIDALAIDPQSPPTIYAAVSFQGIFKSTDGGSHWARSDRGLARPVSEPGLSLAIVPETPQTLYAVVNFKVYKSSDSAAHWTQLKQEPPMTYQVVVDPRRPQFVYALTRLHGVYQSIDGGQSWRPAGLGGNSIHALAIDPQHPGTLFASTSSGLFRRTERALRWQPAGLTRILVLALAIDPEKTTGIYAATSGFGVIRSTDGGKHWHDFSIGLGKYVAPLTFSSDGQNLYAAAPPNLIFAYRFPRP